MRLALSIHVSDDVFVSIRNNLVSVELIWNGKMILIVTIYTIASSVGKTVGYLDGINVGDSVRIYVGATEGCFDGIAVGLKVNLGDELGTSEGGSVGREVVGSVCRCKLCILR